MEWTSALILVGSLALGARYNYCNSYKYRNKCVFLQCSQPCQGGSQVREVVCVQSGVIVPDSECDENVLPVSQRPCTDSSLCTSKLIVYSLTELVSGIFVNVNLLLC